ncbi:hypothetical protein OIO90_004320 [Microbotryomycetes sp. JL221]|nr:hypothetical protein OIO90_004320 [Microbotryomycetes sp. JL221]
MTSISSYTLSQPLPLGNPEWSHARFDRAVDIVQSLPRSGPIQTNYDDKLLLYRWVWTCLRFATEGDIQTSRPGLLDVLGRAKWDAWNKRKGMSQEEAERMYVHGLLKILKGFSDRPQAVELIRELETFSLDSRGMMSSGSFVEGSETDSSATEGERQAPRASTSSRPRHRVSASQRAQPPSHQKLKPSRRTAGPPGPASSVAPSLPNYGPPRTRTDSLRRVESSSDDDDDSDDYSSADDGRRVRRMPSGSGYSQHSQQQQQLQPPFQHQSHSNRPLMSPQQHSFPQPQASSNRLLSPPLQPGPFSPQQAPSSASYFRQQQPAEQGMQIPLTPASYQSAYSAGPSRVNQGFGLSAPQVPAATGSRSPSSAPPHRIQASGSSSAQQTNTNTSSQTLQPSSAVATPGGSQSSRVALDAALDRIQTSLTALHERLTEVERSKLQLSTSSSNTRNGKSTMGGGNGSGGVGRGGIGSPTMHVADSPWTVIQALAIRLMILFKLRDPDTTSRSILRISWTRLVLRLMGGLMRVGRRVLGDLAIVIVVAGAMGRVTGTSEGVGQVLLRVLKALSGSAVAERKSIRGGNAAI